MIKTEYGFNTSDVNSLFDVAAALRLTKNMIPTHKPKLISEPSLKSLFIEMLFGDMVLASGTGFTCQTKAGPVLVTNRHNVTGRHQETEKCLDEKNLAVPNRIRITHNRIGQLGNMIEVYEPLYKDVDIPLWKEHPVLGSSADFVALPLTQLTNVALFPYC